MNADLRTDEDNEFLQQLEERRREIIRDATPQKCNRWWCFQRAEEHTHADQDPDLARKQWLEREKVSNYVKACELELYADTYKWP